MGKNARQIAMEILVRMQRDAAYSNLTLDAALRRNELPARDAALVSALVYGVEERLCTIDYQLSLYLKQPLKKLKPEVLAALRLGVCQLLFMERIPSSAAVCESVSLVKQNGCAFAAGLVNAVLRKVSDAGICLPEQEADALQMLSIRYSFPECFVPVPYRRMYKNGCSGMPVPEKYSLELRDLYIPHGNDGIPVHESISYIQEVTFRFHLS